MSREVKRKKMQNVFSVLGVLVVLIGVGLLGINSYVDFKYQDQIELYTERYSSSPIEANPMEVKEKVYSVVFEAEGFSLYEECCFLEGQEYLFRGVIVSIEPVTELFSVGEVVVLETRDDRVSLTYPGDLVTMFCETNSETVCVGNDAWESCLELFELDNCVLSEVEQSEIGQ